MTAKIVGGARFGGELARRVAKASNAKQLSVGFFEGETYADGTPIAAVAAWNEFGTPTIPPRPFMRQTVKDGQSDWGKLAETALKHSNLDAAQALEICGRMVQGQVQDQVKDWSDPPNAASTVAKKGFNNPLIGQNPVMVNSVEFKVEK